MCLALPARVVELQDADNAVVELGGVRKTVSVALTPEAKVGDYVIVHVGHAIGLRARRDGESENWNDDDAHGSSQWQMPYSVVPMTSGELNPLHTSPPAQVVSSPTTQYA